MNTKHTTTLPDSVERYFEATNRFDAESAAACFEPTATVFDEEKTHVGIDAIRDWVSHTGQLYQAQATVLGAQQNGEVLAVSTRVTGQFPGSPVELTFSFVLGAQKISRLSIQ